MPDQASDDAPPKWGTPDWDDAKERRRGQPHGDHVRAAEPDEPQRASTFSRRADVSELVEMLHAMRVGDGPAAAPRSDAWRSNATILLSAGALALTVVGSSIAVVQSMTRLSDKVDTMDERLHVVERRQTDNIPRLDAQVIENKIQNDRINALVESLADERRARQADEVENRRAQAEILALIAKENDKLADIDKAVAVIQSGGRRSDAGPPDLAPALRPHG